MIKFFGHIVMTLIFALYTILILLGTVFIISSFKLGAWSIIPALFLLMLMVVFILKNYHSLVALIEGEK